MNPESQIPSNRAIDEMLIQHDVQNQKKQKHINLDMCTCNIYTQYQNKQRHLQGVELEKRYVARYRSVKKLKATPQIFFTQQGESLVRCSAKGSIGLVAHACHSARKVPDHDVSWWTMIHVFFTKSMTRPLTYVVIVMRIEYAYILIWDIKCSSGFAWIGFDHFVITTWTLDETSHWDLAAFFPKWTLIERYWPK